MKKCKDLNEGLVAVKDEVEKALRDSGEVVESIQVTEKSLQQVCGNGQGGWGRDAEKGKMEKGKVGRKTFGEKDEGGIEPLR